MNDSGGARGRAEDRFVRWTALAFAGWTVLTALAIVAEMERGARGLLAQLAVHGAIWALGCAGLWLALRSLRRHTDAERRAERMKAQAEAELAAARRLEAVGRLSAGIAHDFNNLLAPILSVSGIVEEELPTESALREDLEEIRSAARKARDLIRALQTLSRKNRASERVDVAAVASDSEELLRRFSGERLAFSLDVAPPVPAVVADRPLLELALANLVVNAREGAVSGRTIRMSVAAVEVSAAEAARLSLHPGRHAAVTVAEGGVSPGLLAGVSEFEPVHGGAEGTPEGAGIGLPTINGMAAQYFGGVVVRRAPGAGWVVRLLLPEAHPPPI